MCDSVIIARTPRPRNSSYPAVLRCAVLKTQPVGVQGRRRAKLWRSRYATYMQPVEFWGKIHPILYYTEQWDPYPCRVLSRSKMFYYITPVMSLNWLQYK